MILCIIMQDNEETQSVLMKTVEGFVQMEIGCKYLWFYTIYGG